MATWNEIVEYLNSNRNEVVNFQGFKDRFGQICQCNFRYDVDKDVLEFYLKINGKDRKVFISHVNDNEGNESLRIFSFVGEVKDLSKDDIVDLIEFINLHPVLGLLKYHEVPFIGVQTGMELKFFVDSKVCGYLLGCIVTIGNVADKICEKYFAGDKY